jgi:hypothetical protein
MEWRSVMTLLLTAISLAGILLVGFGMTPSPNLIPLAVGLGLVGACILISSLFWCWTLLRVSGKSFHRKEVQRVG